MFGFLTPPSDSTSKERSFAWQAASEKQRAALSVLEAKITADSSISQPELDTLGEKWGSRDRLLLFYLRSGDGKCDPNKVLPKLKSTLAYWKSSGATGETDVQGQLERHPITRFWPLSYPFIAPDGCPVQFAKVGAITPAQLIGAAEDGEVGLKAYMMLWLRRALELQASVEQRQHCLGTYDVYDCSGASWEAMDVSSLRVLSRCISLGEQHFPENLYKCFMINAPRWASFIWAAIKPAMSERLREKVHISSGVPEALTAALGGEAAVSEMLASVPEKLPVHDGGERPTGS